MRIVVADDHPLYLEAASIQVQRNFPEAQVDEIASGDELQAVTEEPDAVFDLFLIDYYMPGISFAAISQLVKRYPEAPVAVVSGMARRAEILAAIRAGVRGYIPKTADADYFSHAIHLLLAGGTCVPADILFPETMGKPRGVSTAGAAWSGLLSQREHDVLRRVARGLSNKAIARELGLAEVTVKLHLRRIFQKLNAKSRSEVAVMAAKEGIG